MYKAWFVNNTSFKLGNYDFFTYRPIPAMVAGCDFALINSPLINYFNSYMQLLLAQPKKAFEI